MTGPRSLFPELPNPYRVERADVARLVTGQVHIVSDWNVSGSMTGPM